MVKGWYEEAKDNNAANTIWLKVWTKREFTLAEGRSSNSDQKCCDKVVSNRRHYKHVSQGSVGSFSLGNSHKTHYSRHLHLAAMLLEWWCWTALRSLTIHPYLAFSVTTPGKIRLSLPIFIPSYKCRKIRYVAKMLEP